MTIAELENTPGSILLDCDLKKAYPGNILMNDRIAGEFPALKTRNEWH